MQFIWDETKRKTNLRIHQMDFEDVYDFEWETARIAPTYPSRTGRKRQLATGWLRGEMVTIIISALGTEAYSIVSLRSASIKERKDYEEHR